MAIHQFVMLLIHLKSWKIHLILTFKQCVWNSVNFFLDHKQNKAKLRCTSHLFSWNCAIDLAVICDPDSTVRWVYIPETESAPSGELNWVFGKWPIIHPIMHKWSTAIPFVTPVLIGWQRFIRAENLYDWSSLVSEDFWKSPLILEFIFNT